MSSKRFLYKTTDNLTSDLTRGMIVCEVDD